MDQETLTMHHLLRLLRLLHRLFLLGPGVLPAVLSKYRTGCSVILCGLCACVAIASLLGRRFAEALLWVISGGILLAGFLSDSRMWGPQTGRALGIGAIVVAALAMVLALRHELLVALANSRRERLQMRRIPAARR